MEAAARSVESEGVAAWADARIAELMGAINAATAELVGVIGKVLESTLVAAARLIEDRDRGCRDAPRRGGWTVHHLLYVEDGGETVPENLACLCSRHRDDHHRGVLGIRGDPTKPDGPTFTDR